MSDLWPAPAKLNLFLHITGRRQDGYHNLQTLFQFLDYSDQLEFVIRDDGQIRRLTVVPNVEPEHDLTVRAAHLLQNNANCRLGVDISIEKKLPMGGGLGGGSSNAATTLVALNNLWQLNLPQTKLIEMAASLGADVPIFVYGRAAWAEGIGDKLQAVEIAELWYVVIFPGLMVSTAELFADPELTRDARPIKIRDYFAGDAVNVFEPIARRRYPAVNSAYEWLSNQVVDHSHPPMMTGTGSCVFASFADDSTATHIAQKALRELPSDWQIICAKACNESPLARKLKVAKSASR